MQFGERRHLRRLYFGDNLKGHLLVSDQMTLRLALWHLRLVTLALTTANASAAKAGPFGLSRTPPLGNKPIRMPINHECCVAPSEKSVPA